LRKIYEKIHPSAPIEPDDPGEDIDDEELASINAESLQQQEIDEAEREAAEEAAAAEAEANGGELSPEAAAELEVTKPKPGANEPELVLKELRTAFELYSKGLNSIPCKEVGYVLRTLGQNPTEDEIIALVCEAGCDWDGNFTCEDFLSVAYSTLQKQISRLDDVRAAFRAFDHNGDGNISRDELRDAMIRFGHTFSAAECDEMFEEADLNRDGQIDWGEFLQMMLPGHTHTNYHEEGPKTPAATPGPASTTGAPSEKGGANSKEGSTRARSASTAQ